MTYFTPLEGGKPCNFVWFGSPFTLCKPFLTNQFHYHLY